MFVRLWTTVILLLFLPEFASAEETSCNAEETSCEAPIVESKKENVSSEDLIQWIQENGGLVNPKQEIRRENPDDSSSVVGVFATEQIQPGEILCSIPWDIIIKIDETDGKEYDFYDCDAAHSLNAEIQKGDASNSAPYIQYLLSKPQGRLPVYAWSDAGKGLLARVLGKNLPPLNTKDDWFAGWKSLCGGVSKDELDEGSYMLAATRSLMGLMIPFYDMYNHYNGRQLNTKTTIHKKDRFELKASRQIPRGAQIYTSYTQCSECNDRDEFTTSNIFENYGFVEGLPQKWELGSVTFQVNHYHGGTTLAKGFRVIEETNVPSLQEELERLKIVALEEKEHRDVVSEDEWDVIWEYHRALEIAISSAIEHAGTMEGSNDDFVTCDEYLNQAGYVELGEYDAKSMYQESSFTQHLETEDMCLWLDDTLQICDSYRPHYHDPFVHFSAAYLETMKRVVIVGGGDSMLLHEVLKYPTVELVLALELDQMVVRHSFKHFKTQPHFDDERVQFWFGDAAKSINLLPKEFFGTFDLVLVDLSETVMSNTVTKELDMIGALALLLKPDGIFVKNELYFEQLGKLFDYTIQLYLPDVPHICDQDFVMGSNQIDFLSPNFELMKNHSVTAALLHPLEDPMDHHRLIKHCSKNDAPFRKGICDNHKKSVNDSDKDTTRAGFLVVVEAEHTTAKLQPVADLEESLFSVLKNEGLTPFSTMSYPFDHDGDTIFIIMREGFVAVHTWIEQNYCALDIHLWGGFDKLDKVRHAILEVVGSKNGLWSSFRVVAGGMLGTSTWKDDEQVIGPDTSLACDNLSHHSEPSEVTSTDDSAFDIMIQESLNLLEDKDTVIVIVCGDQNQQCKSLEAFDKDGRFTNVIALWACPSNEHDKPDIQEPEWVSHKVLCGKGVVNVFKDTVDEYGKIGSVIFDPLVPLEDMFEAQEIFIGSDNMFTHKVKEANLLKPNFLLISPLIGDLLHESSNIKNERKKFLKNCLKNLCVEPVMFAEVAAIANERKIDVGLVSSGDPMFMQRVKDVTRNFKKRSGVEAEIKSITGTEANHQPKFKPHFYAVNDYDKHPGLEQLSSQQPLGSQSVYQLKTHDVKAISIERLKQALEHAVSRLDNSVSGLQTFSDIGDGALLVAIMVDGHIVVVWDGDAHVDFNIFTKGEDVNHATHIVEPFMKEMGNMKFMLHDSFPRGTGRVVNFLKDIDDDDINHE